MRVLAINDISCVGKCSLTVALPIISACGVTCDVLPTAFLSTHTGGFEGYTYRDLTEDIPAILKHWKTLGLSFDFIYSGYLGSVEQIDIVATIKNEFLAKNGKFIVDPVMGDAGKLYAGFNEAYVEKMQELCKQADYILPNATEACYLSGVPYPLTKENAPFVFSKLGMLCAKPIITGLTEEKKISVCYADENGNFKTYSHENIDGFFHGAGDVFAAAFVGCLTQQKTEEQAVRLSSDFVANAISHSAKEVSDKRYGLNFEAEIFGFLKALKSE